MFQKLRTVIYYTPDLDRAKEWYTSITGIKPYFDQPYYVGFDINGCELGLDPNDDSSTSGKGAIAYWKVDNIQDAITKCVNLGGAIENDMQNVGGAVNIAIIKDPFGNFIGLISE